MIPRGRARDACFAPGYPNPIPLYHICYTRDNASGPLREQMQEAKKNVDPPLSAPIQEKTIHAIQWSRFADWEQINNTCFLASSLWERHPANNFCWSVSRARKRRENPCSSSFAVHEKCMSSCYARGEYDKSSFIRTGYSRKAACRHLLPSYFVILCCHQLVHIARVSIQSKRLPCRYRRLHDFKSTVGWLRCGLVDIGRTRLSRRGTGQERNGQRIDYPHENRKAHRCPVPFRISQDHDTHT